MADEQKRHPDTVYLVMKAYDTAAVEQAGRVSHITLPQGVYMVYAFADKKQAEEEAGDKYEILALQMGASEEEETWAESTTEIS